MQYYTAPLPWTNVSVSRILPDTARFFARTLDLSVLDNLLTKMKAIVSRTAKPSFMNPFMIAVYFGILIDMILIQGILFCGQHPGFRVHRHRVIVGRCSSPGWWFRS